MENNKGIKMAYFAGVMDGDGSFSLLKKNDKSSLYPIYYPLIQLDNVHKSLVEMFKEEFGGLVIERKSYEAKDKAVRKVCYKWRLEKSNSCEPFLNCISDYMILKKDRCDYLIDYISSNPFKRGVKRDILTIKESEKSYFNMKSLNSHRDSRGKISTKKRTSNSSPLFLSYLAGLMDTDGSFSIKREIPKRGAKSFKFSSTISLSMVDSRSLNYVRENCEFGTFFMVDSKSATNGFCYRFGIYSRNESIEFLKLIIPYLIVKKDVAIELLHFCENFVQMHGIKGVSIEENNRRNESYNKVIQLNKYGVLKPSLIDLEV